MSHAATQIRSWFITNLTGVSGLPTPTQGHPRQIASNVDACVVTSTTEIIQPHTIHDPRTDVRELAIQVICIAGSLAEVDVLSMAAEEAIEGATFITGADLIFQSRDYDENIDTDRDYVSVTLNYSARYFVARNNVDTFI